MSLIKKIDVPKHFAARRAMALASHQPVIRPAEASVLKPAAANGKSTGFIRDFSLEHSSSSAPLAPSLPPQE
jgi:hypothetical protein